MLESVKMQNGERRKMFNALLLLMLMIILVDYHRLLS